MQTLNTVVVIGGINIDIKGASFGTLEDGTSNPGTVSVSPGGVGRNIAENLARLGVPVILLGAVGSGPFAGHVLEETAAAGVDVTEVLSAPDLPSGVYLSLTDEDRQRFTALSDMRVMSLVTPEYLRSREPLIARCGMLVLDANLPADTLTRAAGMAARQGVPVLLEPVSVRKAQLLKSLRPAVTMLTPNALEYRAITGEDPDPRRPKAVPWAERVYVTLGSEGVLKLKADAAENRLFPSPPVSVADENGAGDAFTAGLAAGLIGGLSEDEAVQAGIRAARLTLQSVSTVSGEMRKELLQ